MATGGFTAFETDREQAFALDASNARWNGFILR